MELLRCRSFNSCSLVVEASWSAGSVWRICSYHRRKNTEFLNPVRIRFQVLLAVFGSWCLSPFCVCCLFFLLLCLFFPGSAGADFVCNWTMFLFSFLMQREHLPFLVKKKESCQEGSVSKCWNEGRVSTAQVPCYNRRWTWPAHRLSACMELDARHSKLTSLHCTRFRPDSGSAQWSNAFPWSQFRE
jgi:hypothetical protein